MKSTEDTPKPKTRGQQLAAIDALAGRMTDGIARDGYSVRVAILVNLMRVFDSLTSKDRPETWIGHVAWARMAGISVRHCKRAIPVLQSMNLINSRVTWITAGKRGMKIKIHWAAIFAEGVIEQDENDVLLWIKKRTRQRNLFRASKSSKHISTALSESDVTTLSESDTLSLSEGDTTALSSISHPLIYPPIHPLTCGQNATSQPNQTHSDGWMDGDFESGKEAKPVATTTIPRELPEIIRRLVALGVQQARAAAMASVRAGYSAGEILRILDWLAAESLTDEQGKQVLPYSPAQLVLRLRDSDAVSTDPANGNWNGGKSGFWTRLNSRTSPDTRKVGRKRHEKVQDDKPFTRKRYMASLGLPEISELLESRGADAGVRKSASRYTGVGDLPTVLAYWLRSQGVDVKEVTK
jgi:hypothetical protein